MHVMCLQCSFARYMSGQGFDTWILEVRGAGLSVQETSPKEIQQSALAVSEQMEAVAKTVTNGAFATNQLPTNVPSALSDSMDFALSLIHI